MGTDNRGPKTLIGALLAVVLLALLPGATIGPGRMGPGMMWGYGAQPSTGGWAWGFTMAFGMLLMVAFWVAVILGVVLLVRWTAGKSAQVPDQARPEDPMEILRRRYAAGEIDRATFRRMRDDLHRDAPDGQSTPGDGAVELGVRDVAGGAERSFRWQS